MAGRTFRKSFSSTTRSWMSRWFTSFKEQHGLDSIEQLEQLMFDAYQNRDNLNWFKQHNPYLATFLYLSAHAGTIKNGVFSIDDVNARIRIRTLTGWLRSRREYFNYYLNHTREQIFDRSILNNVKKLTKNIAIPVRQSTTYVDEAISYIDKVSKNEEQEEHLTKLFAQVRQHYGSQGLEKVIKKIRKLSRPTYASIRRILESELPQQRRSPVRSSKESRLFSEEEQLTVIDIIKSTTRSEARRRELVSLFAQVRAKGKSIFLRALDEIENLSTRNYESVSRILRASLETSSEAAQQQTLRRSSHREEQTVREQPTTTTTVATYRGFIRFLNSEGDRLILRSGSSSVEIPEEGVELLRRLSQTSINMRDIYKWLRRSAGKDLSSLWSLSPALFSARLAQLAGATREARVNARVVRLRPLRITATPPSERRSAQSRRIQEQQQESEQQETTRNTRERTSPRSSASVESASEQTTTQAEESGRLQTTDQQAAQERTTQTSSAGSGQLTSEQRRRLERASGSRTITVRPYTLNRTPIEVDATPYYNSSNNVRALLVLRFQSNLRKYRGRPQQVVVEFRLPATIYHRLTQADPNNPETYQNLNLGPLLRELRKQVRYKFGDAEARAISVLTIVESVARLVRQNREARRFLEEEFRRRGILRD